MKLLIALAALIVCATAFEYTAEWEEWKRTNGKDYSSNKEELYRQTIWEANKKIVLEHNANSDKWGWTLEMNAFADLKSSEFAAMYNGYRRRSVRKSNTTRYHVPIVSLPRPSAYSHSGAGGPSPAPAPQGLWADGLGRETNHRYSLCLYTNGPTGTALPDTVDWRTKGAVTPVKNQNLCGSCWAFSTTGSLEGQTFLKKGTLPNLSEQQLVDCSDKYGNNGCQGGLMDKAFKYIKANGGINSEASYPYEAKNGKCRFQQSSVAATCTGYKDIPRNDIDALQNAVANIGPISVAMDASHSSFQLYAAGVYDYSLCSSTQVSHGVLVVGYGTKRSSSFHEEKPYWLVKNSWGPSWGEEGYFKIARKNNRCGIATDASYPTVE